MLEWLLIAQFYTIQADKVTLLEDPPHAEMIFDTDTHVTCNRCKVYKTGTFTLHSGDMIKYEADPQIKVDKLPGGDIQVQTPDVVEYIMSDTERDIKVNKALDILYESPHVFNDEYWNGLEKIYKVVQSPASAIDAYKAFGLSVTGEPQYVDRNEVQGPYFIYGDLPSDLGDAKPTFRALDTADLPVFQNTPNPPPFFHLEPFKADPDTFYTPEPPKWTAPARIDIIKRVQQRYQWAPMPPQSSDSIKPTWFERQQEKHPVIVAKACAFRNSCQWMAPISSFAMSVLLPIGLALLK